MNKFNSKFSHNDKKLHSPDIKISKHFHEAKLGDDQWRYRLFELQQQQEELNQEFKSLNVFSPSSSNNDKKQQGTIHHHANTSRSHNHHHFPEKHINHHKICPVTASRNAEPGKNFFGYHSAPGVHNLHHLTAEELEKELDEYFRKPEIFARKKRLSSKLNEQRKENKTIQKKSESWKNNSSNRKSLSIHPPKSQRHLATLREELLPHNFDDETNNEKNNITQQTERNSKSIRDNESKRQSRSLQDKNTKISESSTEDKKVQSNEDTKDTFHSEFYAPDGKVRTVMTLPNTDESFKEAEKARYVRTRFKRSFERQISNSEIFK